MVRYIGYINKHVHSYCHRPEAFYQIVDSLVSHLRKTMVHSFIFSTGSHNCSISDSEENQYIVFIATQNRLGIPLVIILKLDTAAIWPL